MGWLAWLSLGGLVGILAGQIMHSRLGWVGDCVVGILGVPIGSFLFSVVGAPGATGFNLWTVIVAFIGTIILIGLMRIAKRTNSVI